MPFDGGSKVACPYAFALRNFGEIMENRKHAAVEISAAFICFSPATACRKLIEKRILTPRGVLTPRRYGARGF
jgi:hypothetical protein